MRAHNQNSPDTLSPAEAQEWETTSEVEEITYHVPVVQINTPPAARNGIHFTLLLSTSQNPVQLALGRDYDRSKAYIQAVDWPIVIAQSLAQAQSAVNLNQPGQPSSLTPVGGSGTFTAAGGSASLPLLIGANQYLTGFDVSAGLATTGYTGPTTVTVSNVAGGPYTYYLQESTTAATMLSIRYPGNGLILNGGQPTVTVSASTDGASGNISVYGQSASAITASVSGQILPAGAIIPIDHCDEVWVAATSGLLGRVAVEVCRTERASA